MNLKKIIYTLKHKIAFLKVERQLLGRNTLRGFLHDIDKVFLYLVLNAEYVSKIHRKYARHHEKKARTEKDFTEMVIDWECGRFTKKDKPLNAYMFLMIYKPHLIGKVLPLLKRFKIDTPQGG